MKQSSVRVWDWQALGLLSGDQKHKQDGLLLTVSLYQEGSRKDQKRAQEGQKERWVNEKWGTLCFVEMQHRMVEHIALEDISPTLHPHTAEFNDHQNKLRVNQKYRAQRIGQIFYIDTDNNLFPSVTFLSEDYSIRIICLPGSSRSGEQWWLPNFETYPYYPQPLCLP